MATQSRPKIILQDATHLSQSQSGGQILIPTLFMAPERRGSETLSSYQMQFFELEVPKVSSKITLDAEHSNSSLSAASTYWSSQINVFGEKRFRHQYALDKKMMHMETRIMKEIDRFSPRIASGHDRNIIKFVRSHLVYC